MMPNLTNACPEFTRASRRSFLQCGALTAAWLSLAVLLRLEASAGGAARVTNKSVILR